MAFNGQVCDLNVFVDMMNFSVLSILNTSHTTIYVYNYAKKGHLYYDNSLTP